MTEKRVAVLEYDSWGFRWFGIPSEYLVQGTDHYLDSSMSTPSLSAFCNMNCRI